MFNVDAAFDIDSGREAIGVIIRDYTGQFVAARNMFSPHVVDAPMAEAYAFREGLVLAQTMGSNNFIIQTDCMQVMDTMKNGSFSATSLAAIYHDCKILLSGLENVSVEYCNREANQAHELARDAYISGFSCNWVDEPLSFILNKLANDVIVLSDQ
jgi:ribonuclease HI